MNTAQNHPVVFYDGVCVFCNSAVQWVLQRDPGGTFLFAPLQGKLAGEILPAHGHDPSALDTVVLLKEGKLYTRSDALLQVMKELNGRWKVLFWLGSAIPAPFRDWLYHCLAKNRYRWFGRKEKCLLPRPEWKARFLD